MSFVSRLGYFPCSPAVRLYYFLRPIGTRLPVASASSTSPVSCTPPASAAPGPAAGAQRATAQVASRPPTPRSLKIKTAARLLSPGLFPPYTGPAGVPAAGCERCGAAARPGQLREGAERPALSPQVPAEPGRPRTRLLPPPARPVAGGDPLLTKRNETRSAAPGRGVGRARLGSARRPPSLSFPVLRGAGRAAQPAGSRPRAAPCGTRQGSRFPVPPVPSFPARRAPLTFSAQVSAACDWRR